MHELTRVFGSSKFCPSTYMSTVVCAHPKRTLTIKMMGGCVFR